MRSPPEMPRSVVLDMEPVVLDENTSFPSELLAPGNTTTPSEAAEVEEGVEQEQHNASNNRDEDAGGQIMHSPSEQDREQR
jgi:hypothetical protein